MSATVRVSETSETSASATALPALLAVLAAALAAAAAAAPSPQAPQVTGQSLRKSSTQSTLEVHRCARRAQSLTDSPPMVTEMVSAPG